mgnify:CR=1 FL=1
MQPWVCRRRPLHPPCMHILRFNIEEYEFISYNSDQEGDMTAKVAERGQVTIPKSLRDRLGIRPGTVLEFTEEGGRLVAVKVEALDPVDQAYGKFGHKRRTDDILRKLRGD